MDLDADAAREFLWELEVALGMPQTRGSNRDVKHACL